MARKVTVTAEQVNAAADAMKAEGIRPTSRAIREALGEDASMGSINRLLNRWKGAQERPAEPDLELSDSVQQAIVDFMAAKLNATSEAFEAELAEQHREVADLASENESQLDMIDNLQADLEAARAEVAHEREVAEHARTELAKAQLRLESLPHLEEAAEKAHMELAKAQFKLESIPRLEEAAEQARTELFKNKLQLEAMARLEQELATVRGELEAERHELGEIHAELEEERDLRIKAQQFIIDPIFKQRVMPNAGHPSANAALSAAHPGANAALSAAANTASTNESSVADEA
jgi:chromosome segregation ATPase